MPTPATPPRPDKKDGKAVKKKVPHDALPAPLPEEEEQKSIGYPAPPPPPLGR
jgi:hypothetical protein